MKNIALFFISPFIGLAYVIALPWVFLYHVVSLGVERVGVETEIKEEEWTS